VNLVFLMQLSQKLWSTTPTLTTLIRTRRKVPPLQYPQAEQNFKLFSICSLLLSTLSLKEDNFFTSLLSGRVGVVKEGGVIFIDHTPDLFVPILVFLRTGRITLRGLDEDSVRAEAAFYGIEVPRTTPCVCS
jgi:hypothetical protein